MNRHVLKNARIFCGILGYRVPGKYRYWQALRNCGRDLSLLLGVGLPFDSAGVADGDILPLDISLPP